MIMERIGILLVNTTHFSSSEEKGGFIMLQFIVLVMLFILYQLITKADSCSLVNFKLIVRFMISCWSPRVEEQNVKVKRGQATSWRNLELFSLVKENDPFIARQSRKEIFLFLAIMKFIDKN